MSDTENTAMLTYNDLQRFITDQQIAAEIILMQIETATVPAAADALQVTVDQIAKTVIFFIDGRPYAVIANGVRRVDSRKLADRFNVPRKKVKLAHGEAVLATTGYAPGTVPPFGHRQPIPVLMSPTVSDQALIYAGGGGIHAMIKIRSDELRRVTNAEILDVLEAV